MVAQDRETSAVAENANIAPHAAAASKLAIPGGVFAQAVMFDPDRALHFCDLCRLDDVEVALRKGADHMVAIGGRSCTGSARGILVEKKDAGVIAHDTSLWTGHIDVVGAALQIPD